MREIPFFGSYVSPKAKEYVAQVLDSGMLSEGEWTRRFERAIERFHGYPENSVVATNSGTSALHLALKTLGVGEGDEVIIPPLTFIATGLAVLYCGAKPVFADILPDGTIDPEEVKKVVTLKTKAIIAVNWAGRDCELERLASLAEFYGIKLIVDAAQAFGCFSFYADAICFSFQATKHITTGDGGAVYFKDFRHSYYGRNLSWFGIDRIRSQPDILGERLYSLQEIGFKYHMNNVSAAIGLANIEDADRIIQRRKIIAHRYELSLLRAKPVHKDNSTFWAYPIVVGDTHKFHANNVFGKIPCSIIHKGIDGYEIFYTLKRLPQMRVWEKTVTHLPIHMDLTDEDVQYIIEKVNEYV